MPGYARKDIVREGEIGIYHCWSRCVQRAFLCGYDPVTDHDFDYRRGWIEDLLAYQARVFAVDVGNFNVLSNHAHAILRTRPDLAATWSPEELALRWKLAWPEFRDGQWVREPTDQELDRLLAQPTKIEQIRRNLSSLSWFMARWKEPMARLCNAETDNAGHFWDARFKCRELLDDEAVLTCSIYVDLNQLRAGLTETLEGSSHSAIRQRILAAKAREALTSWEDVRDRDPHGQAALPASQAEALFADCWLAPIAVTGPLLTTTSRPTADSLPAPRSEFTRLSLEEPVMSEGVRLLTVSPAGPTAAEAASPEVPSEAGALERSDVLVAPDHSGDSDASRETSTRWRPKLTRPRASDSPFLAMAWSEYLRVVQAMAHRVAMGQSAPPAPTNSSEVTLRETLARWGINPGAWLEQLHQLDCQCSRALGTSQHVLHRAQGVAQQRFHGIRLCRELFTTIASDAFT